MRLPLNLDNYLLSFATFNALNELNNAYYENDNYISPKDNYEVLVKEKFHTAYQIYKIIDTDTSYKDMWAILNLIYAMKGVTNAIKKFCEYLGLTCVVTRDENNELLTLVGNLSTLSVNSFLIYMQQMIQELIFINKSDSTIRIDDLIIKYDVEFINSNSIAQILISQKTADTILRPLQE